MKKILTLIVLLGGFALAADAAGAAGAVRAAGSHTNISRVKGTYIQLSAEGDRGYGAGMTVGVSRIFGNGFSLSAGLGGEWNQRPNNGNNFFVDGFGEAKYSLLKGSVSPFLAARVKLRYMIPHHLQEGVSLGEFYSTSTQFDIFGIGLVGIDFSRFAIWGGLGGGPSLFSEDHKDPNTLKVNTSGETFLDLSYNIGFTFWF